MMCAYCCHCKHVYVNCLPLLPFSSTNVERSCSPSCFDVLTYGFCLFLLTITLLLTLISLGIYLIFLVSFFHLQYSFLCGCSGGLSAIDFLSSNDRIFLSNIQNLTNNHICAQYFYIPFLMSFICGVRYTLFFFLRHLNLLMEPIVYRCPVSRCRRF